MYLPKTDIYNILNNIDSNYTVSQSYPAVFDNLPSIIFKVNDNSINSDLDNNIVSQSIEVGIDIWADDSLSASTVLNNVEHAMRSNLYNLSYSADIPNISDDIYHINCRFVKLV